MYEIIEIEYDLYNIKYENPTIFLWSQTGKGGSNCKQNLTTADFQHILSSALYCQSVAILSLLGQSMTEAVFLTLGRSGSSHLKKLGLRPNA